MGDINARIGKPENEVEERYIGKYGENTRNEPGKRAMQFFIDTDLLCLNNRTITDQVQYTYHQSGRETHKSIIDLICISRGMYRPEHQATVLPTTITGSESHYPVLTKIKYNRSTPKRRHTKERKVWNLSGFRNSENKRKKFKDDMTDRLKDFHREAEKLDLNSIGTADLQQLYRKFTYSFREVADKHIKKITIKHTGC